MENLPMGKQAGPNRVPNGVYKLMASHFAPKFEKVLAEVLTSGKYTGPYACCVIGALGRC